MKNAPTGARLGSGSPGYTIPAEYTVFGETIEGFDVIDKIASVKKDAADRPEVDVKIIKASIVKK